MLVPSPPFSFTTATRSSSSGAASPVRSSSLRTSRTGSSSSPGSVPVPPPSSWSYRRRNEARAASDTPARRIFSSAAASPGAAASLTGPIVPVRSARRTGTGAWVSETIEAVVFDLDGVLVQSEELWDAARRELVAEAGLDWPPDATDAMMGMSSLEWSRYVHEQIGVPADPEAINAAVLERVEARYRSDLPWIPGAPPAGAPMAEPRRPRGGRPDGGRLAARPGHVVQPRDRRPGGGGGRLRRRVRGHRVIRGGRARQARAGRVPRGRPQDGRGAGAVGRDRGLDQRPARRARGRHAGGRDPERRASAGATRSRRGRRRARLDRRAPPGGRVTTAAFTIERAGPDDVDEILEV